MESLCDRFLPVMQSRADREHDSLATRILERYDLFVEEVVVVVDDCR